MDKTVLFDYSPTRGGSAPLPMLGSSRGYLQTDGYAVYEKYARNKEVAHLACWAHARREFERALDNDKSRAEKAMLLIQQLYAVKDRHVKKAQTQKRPKHCALKNPCR